jgi:hypothetical protein
VGQEDYYYYFFFSNVSLNLCFSQKLHIGLQVVQNGMEDIFNSQVEMEGRL